MSSRKRYDSIGIFTGAWRFPMTSWFLAAVLLCCAGLSAFILYRMHRHKQERLELRLLTGRSRLLEEEVAQHLEALQSFDQEAFDAQRQKAENALNQMHLFLIERQAHLLNYEDLINLQHYKINILTSASDHALKDLSPSSGPDIALDSEPYSEPAAPRQDRASLEDQLLNKISQLNKKRRDEK